MLPKSTVNCLQAATEHQGGSSSTSLQTSMSGRIFLLLRVCEYTKARLGVAIQTLPDSTQIESVQEPGNTIHLIKRYCPSRTNLSPYQMPQPLIRRCRKHHFDRIRSRVGSEVGPKVQQYLPSLLSEFQGRIYQRCGRENGNRPPLSMSWFVGWFLPFFVFPSSCPSSDNQADNHNYNSFKTTKDELQEPHFMG